MRLLVWCALSWIAGILVHGAVGGPTVAWTLVAAAVGLIVLAFGRGLALVALCLGAATVGLDDPATPRLGPATFEGVVARPVEPLADGRLVVVDIDGVVAGPQLEGTRAR